MCQRSLKKSSETGLCRDVNLGKTTEGSQGHSGFDHQVEEVRNYPESSKCYPSGLQEPGRMGLGQENLPEFTTLQHTI